MNFKTALLSLIWRSPNFRHVSGCNISQRPTPSRLMFFLLFLNSLILYFNFNNIIRLSFIPKCRPMSWSTRIPPRADKSKYYCYVVLNPDECFSIDNLVKLYLWLFLTLLLIFETIYRIDFSLINNSLGVFHADLCQRKLVKWSLRFSAFGRNEILKK